jgi:hypothetical protein
LGRPLTVTLTPLATSMHFAQILATLCIVSPFLLIKEINMTTTEKKPVTRTVHKKSNNVRIIYQTDVFHPKGSLKNNFTLRPLKNAPFCLIPTSGSNFNPQNTQCIPVVKIFAFLGLEQN